MKYSLSILIIISSITSSNVYSQNAEAWQNVKNLVGKKVTRFQGETLKNEVFNLVSYKGQNIMLIFWSRYCGSCKGNS